MGGIALIVGTAMIQLSGVFNKDGPKKLIFEEKMKDG